MSYRYAVRAVHLDGPLADRDPIPLAGFNLLLDAGMFFTGTLASYEEVEAGAVELQILEGNTLVWHSRNGRFLDELKAMADNLMEEDMRDLYKE